MSRSGRDKHVRRTHMGDSTRTPCRYGCGRTYCVRSKSLAHHERACDHKPNAANIGYGSTTTTFSWRCHQCRPKNKPVQDNFRLYRRVLNTNQNMFEQVQHVVMHDARGILRRQRQNVKFYITGNFIFERPSVLVCLPIHQFISIPHHSPRQMQDPSKNH